MVAKPHVLLADSDAHSRKPVHCLLAEMGCTVEEVLLEDLPRRFLNADVVLCSWEDMHHDPEHLLPHVPPVVLVGHSPEEADWRQAFAEGAFDIVEEPHTPESVREFQRVVRGAVEFSEEENGSDCRTGRSHRRPRHSLPR